MYNNPTSSDEDQEWVELYNPSVSELDLSYWTLRDSEDLHVFRFPAGTLIPANGYFLIARTKASYWTAPALEGLSFSLDDNGDQVRLFDPNDCLITEVEYNDSGEWPEGADGEGGSLELLQVSRPNGAPSNWAVSGLGGTPGLPNAHAITDSTYHDYNVTINEIFYHPEDEETDDNLDAEYIELYNNHPVVVDLSGWYFSRGIEFHFPEGASIPGNGYLLVCRSTGRYPNVPNRIGNYSLQLNNGGEALGLTNDLGVVVDYVDYNDQPPWPVLPDGEDHSLELISPIADNTAAQYWRNGQPMSPGAQNAVYMNNTPPRITRVQHTPEFPAAAVSEDRTEYNTIVEVGDSWRYFKGTSAPPSDWNSIDFNDSAWDEGPSGFGYSDNDDATELSDMQNQYVSVYIRTSFEVSDLTGYTFMTLGMDYDDSFIAYLNGVEVARSNVSGSPPAFDRTADGNHEAGAMESFDLTNYLPLLQSGTNVLAVEGHNTSLTSSDFSLIPQLETGRVIPAEEGGSSKVVITARIRDDDGISEAVLHYQRLTSPLGAGLILMDWESVPLYDDGTHGDQTAGDSYYSFTFTDAEKLEPYDIWRYKISAKDTLGNEAILPLQDELTRHYAFFVEDLSNAPDFPTTYLFMESSVLSWLNRNVESNVEQPCIVVMDGEVFDLYHGGGVRYRGYGLRNKPKKSWRVVFPKGNRWDDRRAINLNANYHTSPLIRGEAGYMEHLAYEFFREMGVSAADTEHRRVVLNGSYYGLFIMPEQYNEDFLNAHDLADETRIFQAGIQGRRSDLSVELSFDDYVQKYENTLGADEDIQILINFIEALDSAADLKAFFEANLDIDQFLAYLTGVAAVSFVDSAEKNYMPTRGADGRWFVMPWDISHCWGEVSTRSSYPFQSDFGLLDGAESGVYGINVLRNKFLSVPEYRERYFSMLRDIAGRNFTRSHLDPWFDTYWEYLHDAIDENMQRWNSPGDIQNLVPEMKNYVSARRDFILNDSNVRQEGIPTKPENLSPANGETINPDGTTNSVNLQARMDVGLSSEWEIQESSADFYHPFWSGANEPDVVDSLLVPQDVLLPGVTYFWRVRYQSNDGVWSDWSDPTSFTTSGDFPLPEVRDIVVTPLDQSVRLEWTLPEAADLLRVDIYEGNDIIESAPIDDNRVRITDLENGLDYYFTIRTVAKDRRSSQGITVHARPATPLQEGDLIAYFRFEGDTIDSGGLFENGTILGTAEISAPGLPDPVPLTKTPNSASLDLKGAAGNGFQFGAGNPYLNVIERLTLECFTQLAPGATGAMTLVDRYNESNAPEEGVWRFGIGFSQSRSLDFFLNDGDSNSGFSGRLHIASREGVIPTDAEVHHYAVVVNLSEDGFTDKVCLYIDGRSISTTIVHEDGVSDYNAFRTGGAQPVYIGAKQTSTGTAEPLQGRIDEVRLTAGALETDQFLQPVEVLPGVTDWALY